MTTAISIAGLVKSFGRTRALDGLALDVEAGEVHGFLGPNGAGKSTTLRVLLGLLRADAGTVTLLGGDPWRDVPGDVTLWPNLTGGEVIDLLGRLRGGLGTRRRAQRSSRRAWLWADDGTEYLLAGTATRIGRGVDNDNVLDDPAVSRHQAGLEDAEDGWWLLPEGTGNGAYCNGHLVQPGGRLPVGPRHGPAVRPAARFRLVTSAPGPDPAAFRFVAASRSTPGGKRKNEDAYLATATLLAVADGVGGRIAGQIASRVAIHQVATADPRLGVAERVGMAHAAVVGQADASPALTGMATTLDVARIYQDNGEWRIEGAPVGDGFVLVQDSSGVCRLTAPDIVGTQLEKDDPVRAERLRDDPDFRRMVAAVGFPGPLRPTTWGLTPRVGLRLLLASDGLLDRITFTELEDALIRHWNDDVKTTASALLALAATSRDNVTLVVADVEHDYTATRSPTVDRDLSTTSTGG